jgi:hypothetical protein
VVYFAIEGVKAISDMENIEVACSHFENVYNRESSFDPTVIEEALQHPKNLSSTSSQPSKS